MGNEERNANKQITMKISIEEVVRWIEQAMADTEFMLLQLDCQPTEDDYWLNEKGEKKLTSEWLNNMPRPYASLLGKHSALLDLRRKFIEAEKLHENEFLERDIILSNPRYN